MPVAGGPRPARADRRTARPGTHPPPTATQKELYPAAVTFPALAEGNVRTLVGTIFIQARRLGSGKGDEVDGGWCFSTLDEAYQASRAQVAIYQQWAQAGWIKLVTKLTPEQIPPLEGQYLPPQVLLMLEGATGVRNADDLREFYAAGVRILSLTWAEGSPWSGGNTNGGDLSPKGRELVGEIDRLGMIHDVSHLGEQAFWSLLGSSQGPICATHSNCRALLPGMEKNERHLTDQQIRALLERTDRTGATGMMGINLYTRFLAVGRRAGIADVVAQVQHVCQLTGRADGVGLGSDMDGGFNAEALPEGLDHPRHLPRLAEALSNAGFTDAQIAGFQSRNWQNYFKRTLGG